MNERGTNSPDRVVHEYRLNRGRLALLYISVVTILVVLLLVYIWQYIRMVEIHMRIKEVDTELQRITERMDALSLERVRLSRLERIDFSARERLGMRPPSASDILYLSPHSGDFERDGDLP